MLRSEIGTSRTRHQDIRLNSFENVHRETLHSLLCRVKLESSDTLTKPLHCLNFERFMNNLFVERANA